MKKLIAFLVVALFATSCMTYKDITNTYYLTEGSEVHFENSPQSVAGSEADDSLNGNDVTPTVKIK